MPEVLGNPWGVAFPTVFDTWHYYFSDDIRRFEYIRGGQGAFAHYIMLS